MTEWKEEIKNRVVQHNKKRVEISEALNKLINELTHSPYNLKALCKLVDELNLKWQITIESKEVLLSINDLKDFKYETIYDDIGNAVDGKEIELSDSLKKFILDKFKW